MADSAVTITQGSGTSIDTRTEADNGQHRQVIVIGDPSTTAGVAPVDATAGLTVNLGTNNDVTITSGTVDLGATDNAVLDAIAASLAGTLAVSNAGLTELAAAIDTEVQVDVVGALPAGTNAIGKLAANSGVDIGDVDILSIAAGDNNIGNVDLASSIPAGTNNIGDVDVLSIVPGTGATNLGKAEDGAHTTGDTGVMALAVRNDNGTTSFAGDNTDYSPLAVDSNGHVWVRPQPNEFELAGNTAHVKKYYTNAGAVTDGIIWSPAAGKRWYVTDIFIQVSAASTVTLEDDLVAGDAAVWKAELAANSGWSHSFQTPWFSGEDAADLLITTTAGNVYVTVTGYEI